jgi:hypothetical protein
MGYGSDAKGEEVMWMCKCNPDGRVADLQAELDRTKAELKALTCSYNVSVKMRIAERKRGDEYAEALREMYYPHQDFESLYTCPMCGSSAQHYQDIGHTPDCAKAKAESEVE